MLCSSASLSDDVAIYSDFVEVHLSQIEFVKKHYNQLSKWGVVPKCELKVISQHK